MVGGGGGGVPLGIGGRAAVKIKEGLKSSGPVEDGSQGSSLVVLAQVG